MIFKIIVVERYRGIRSLIYIVLTGVLIISKAGCQSVNLVERTFIGMNKTDVMQILGEPNKVEELTKTTEYIFGSVEGLWDQIQMGEKIVIWKYEDRDGYKELYFLNDESEVVGEFYWYNDPEKNPVF